LNKIQIVTSFKQLWGNNCQTDCLWQVSGQKRISGFANLAVHE